MATFRTPRRFDRVTTRLPARILSDSGPRPVMVLELSQGGLYCEGAGLKDVAGALRVHLSLTTHADEPAWTPKSSPGERDREPAPVRITAEAEVIYRDLGREGGFGGSTDGLGLRLVSMPEADRLELLRFISMLVFERHAWRTRAGAPGGPPPGLMEAERQGLTAAT